ncbi:DUF3048 domain-containing protein [Candidatus Saccharibacteria bacterium]|nr:DUF3048 domain-containing protein [Candidatus Saccharibacteria bacterium]
MDSRKKAQRAGKKIKIRDGDADEALKTIEENEVAERLNEITSAEESEAETDFLDDEKEIDDSEDIAKFLEKSRDTDESDVPEKKDKKTRQKKAAKKRQAKVKHSLVAILITLFILAIIGTLAFFLLRPIIEENKLDQPDATNLESDKIYYSPLTGLEVASQEAITAAATCVMIENSPDARPQSGLDQAGVVFEANAEGGITRFMAIYQEAKPQFLGPIRSLRMTYAEMAKPFHCSILHMGGAGNALNLVRNNSEFRDLEGMFYERKWVWREGRAIAGKKRYGPHNVYTSFTKIDAWNYDKGYNTSAFNGFARIDPDQPPAEVERNATVINIKMSSDTFNPVFTYNPDTNSYLRAHKRGGAHMSAYEDGTQVQISPKVVIAAKVNSYIRPGSREGYADYTTTGENQAYIFQNGTVTIGTWKREDANAELKFYDGDGNIIKLNRGQVWISLYPSNSGNVQWN